MVVIFPHGNSFSTGLIAKVDTWEGMCHSDSMVTSEVSDNGKSALEVDSVKAEDVVSLGLTFFVKHLYTLTYRGINSDSDEKVAPSLRVKDACKKNHLIFIAVEEPVNEFA